MTMALSVSSVLPVRATLGEGPIWDAASARLWWIDIHGKVLHRYDPARGQDESWPMPAELGTVVPRRGGGVIVALQDGLYAVDQNGTITALGASHDQGPGFRFNDGKCDSHGRLWVGTLAYENGPPRCNLYRWDGRSMRCVCTGIGLSNGIGWSPDNRTMYYIDSPTRRLDAFDFDLEAGEISGRRTVVAFPDAIGIPDGLAVDAEGMVWIGMWGGARVQRCDPLSGILLEHIPLPVPNVTACGFAGPHLGDLYITTATFKTDLVKYPQAGQVFRCRPGVAGLLSHPCV
jgi:sugar lactone lactonase YvrE